MVRAGKGWSRIFHREEGIFPLHCFSEVSPLGGRPRRAIFGEWAHQLTVKLQGCRIFGSSGEVAPASYESRQSRTQRELENPSYLLKHPPVSENLRDPTYSAATVYFAAHCHLTPVR